MGTAYAAGRETELGSLHPGKLADITVLDRDVLMLPTDALLEARVRNTIVGGRIVYDAGEPATDVAANGRKAAATH
jgi:hypothetical protein